MKETWLFEYVPCSSPLCRLSPLVKIIALIIICITAASAPPLLIFCLFPAYIPLFILAGRGAVMQLTGMWRLYIFFAISGLVKYLTSGSRADGASFALMLLLMFFSGLLFYSTTRISEFRRAVARILDYLPFINGDHIAGLIAMTMAFLPLIFKTSSELSEAGYSRGFRAGKKPVRTIKLKSIPLMINLFIKADEMTDAYYSRCYDAGEKPADKSGK